MSKITEPFPLFLDTNGQPLENGQIFVGLPNQDPRANPVQLYTDEARTIPIAQPVRTLGGRPAFQGAPTNLYANEITFSITVLNRRGALVVTAPETDSLNALDVLFKSDAIGSVNRSVAAKLDDTVSIKDFGAVGDGVADDSAAFQSAALYIATTGRPVYVPPGVYLTDPFQLTSNGLGGQGILYGEEANSTIIRRRTPGVGPFVVLGSPLATFFQAKLYCRGLFFDGGATTNGPCVEMYDVVRSLFEEVTFSGGSIAMKTFGGICNTFNHCIFELAGRGMEADSFASLTGGGWPNDIRFNDCHFVDNDEWGAWVDNARVIIFKGCQIEANGTTPTLTQGGLYVGPNMGAEVTVTDPESLGVIVESGWFEANVGLADVFAESGINSISNSNFFTTAAQNVHDIRIDGGSYRLRNLNMSFPKTTSILEGAGVGVGNTIEFAQGATLSINQAKTSVYDGRTLLIAGSPVPGVNGAASPLIQRGIDASGANPTITFPTPFRPGTTPRIICQPAQNSAATIDNVEIYGENATGFTMRKKQFNGTTIGTANYTVYWIAIGENPLP